MQVSCYIVKYAHESGDFGISSEVSLAIEGKEEVVPIPPGSTCQRLYYFKLIY